MTTTTKETREMRRARRGLHPRVWRATAGYYYLEANGRPIPMSRQSDEGVIYLLRGGFVSAPALPPLVLAAAQEWVSRCKAKDDMTNDEARALDEARQIIKDGKDGLHDG